MVERSSIENAFAIEGAKLASAFCVSVAAASSAPILAPVAGLGAAAYVSAIALDAFLTGKLCILPLSRMTVGDMLLLAAGKGRPRDQLPWDKEYESRAGFDAPVPVFRLEPTTIDVKPVPQIEQLDRLFPDLPEVPLVTRRAVPVATQLEAAPPIERRAAPREPLVKAVERRADVAPSIERIVPRSQRDISTEHLWEAIDRHSNYFVVGNPGSGKGMIVANLLRRKLEQLPNALVLVLDPKGDRKEDGYWNHPRIHRHSFKGAISSKPEWDSQVADFLDVANQHMERVLDSAPTENAHVWIVFDEMMSLKRNLSLPTFEQVKTTLCNAIGMGDSSGVHGMCVTQSFNAGDSVDSEEIQRVMCLIGIFKQDDYNRAAKVTRLGKVNGQLTEGDFLSLCQASPRDRVMCVAGKFISAPELRNYSTWDRDSQQVIQADSGPSRSQLKPTPSLSPWDEPEEAIGDRWEPAKANANPIPAPLVVPGLAKNG